MLILVKKLVNESVIEMEFRTLVQIENTQIVFDWLSGIEKNGITLLKSHIFNRNKIEKCTTMASRNT